MEWELFSKIATEAGIAAVAIAAILYLVMYLTKSHKEDMESARIERQETQQAFMAFVDANNHQKTDLVRESTSAIIEARKAIELHTELLREHINTRQ